MNFWFKLGLLSAFLITYGLAVWHAHTWYDAYKQSKIVIREQVETKQAMHDSSQIDTKFNDITATLRQQEQSAEEALYEIPSTHCKLNPHGLQLLNAAVVANHPAR